MAPEIHEVIFQSTTKLAGRKWTAFGFFLASGIAMVATFGVHIGGDESYKGTAVNILALIGKFCITGGWMVMFLFTNELYPTVIRSMGMAVSQAAGRTGGIVAPMMLLMTDNNLVIPFVVMGVMMLLNCVCVLLLPETRNRPLQDILSRKRRKINTQAAATRGLHGVDCTSMFDTNIRLTQEEIEEFVVPRRM